MSDQFSGGFDSRSGNGPASVVPDEIKGWSWGAAFLTWIWGLCNHVYISLLAFVPFVNLVFWIVLGIKGNEWAWRSKKWQSVEAFKSTQRKWNIAGIIVLVLSIIMMVLLIFSSLAIVALGGAREKARDAKRVSDVKQMQVGLELYYADAGNYPMSLQPGGQLANGRTVYMSSLPTNPQPSGDSCPSNFEYSYQPVNSGKDYVLTFCLDGSVGTLSEGIHKASQMGLE